MGKGFGTPVNQVLGYVLQLIPELGIYAAEEGFYEQEAANDSYLKFSENLDENDRFIDITNSLEKARIWPNRKAAEKGVQDYLSFLVRWINSKNLPFLDVFICALKKNNKGGFVAEVVQHMQIQRVEK